VAVEGVKEGVLENVGRGGKDTNRVVVSWIRRRGKRRRKIVYIRYTGEEL
jgi:hypothetical protein